VALAGISSSRRRTKAVDVSLGALPGRLGKAVRVESG
jgi:hypothetical protein